MRSVEPPKPPSLYRVEESRNKVVILENIEEEAEERAGKRGEEESKFKSKRSRFEQTNKEIREQPSDG